MPTLSPSPTLTQSQEMVHSPIHGQPSQRVVNANTKQRIKKPAADDVVNMHQLSPSPKHNKSGKVALPEINAHPVNASNNYGTVVSPQMQ